MSEIELENMNGIPVATTTMSVDELLAAGARRMNPHTIYVPSTSVLNGTKKVTDREYHHCDYLVEHRMGVVMAEKKINMNENTIFEVRESSEERAEESTLIQWFKLRTDAEKLAAEYRAEGRLLIFIREI